MPSPEAEAARALIDAAAEDEGVVAALLDDLSIGDRVIGFHAQQAVEKFVKAVLAGRGEDYPFTHDIVRLLDQINRSSLPAELPVADAEDLTPWAVELRYGGASSSALDRKRALEVVQAFREWAEGAVSQA